MSKTRPLALLMQIFLCASCATSIPEPQPPDANARPDFNGIWQAQSTAYWNIEPHPAYAGSESTPDAFDAASGGLGIVANENGMIPYQAWARSQQQRNFATRKSSDPARKCYLPGVPRANYMPYPMQIVQTDDHFFIAYEFAQASRTVYLDKPNFEAPVDTWMGHSLGRWEGTALVVDVSAQVAETWLDRAGNFHSEQLHVQERYTLESPYHLRYQATLTDPKVFTSPFTISVLLYKNITPNAQLLDFKCVEFTEELMYGHLSTETDDE